MRFLRFLVFALTILCTGCAIHRKLPVPPTALPPEQSGQSGDTITKAFEPPTISCSASPTVLKPGDIATVTALGVSLDNRPLTYQYSASSGSISGQGPTATFSSLGAPTGVVSITCSATNDEGQTASANISVTIQAPPAAPSPAASALCSILFPHPGSAVLTPEQHACLDQLALTLRISLDSRLLLVGNATSTEAARHPGLAAQRAIGAKGYLVARGIDPDRILLGTGQVNSPILQSMLIPTGASFTQENSGVTPIDEASRVAASGQGASSPPPPSPPPTCHAYALFGYPGTINVDSAGIAQSFRLVLGNFDPAAGIPKSSAVVLCQGAGFNTSQPNCISDAEWSRLSRGCDLRAPASFPSADGESNYQYLILPISNTLTAAVCPILDFPGWMKPAEKAQCFDPSQNPVDWRWFGTVGDLSKVSKGDNSAHLTVSQGSISLLPLGVGAITLIPKRSTIASRAGEWTSDNFIEFFKEHMKEWIFGSSGLLVTLIGLITRPWKKEEEQPAQAAAEPQHAQPVIIVVPQPQQNQQEDAGVKASPQPRTGRRPPSHR